MVRQDLIIDARDRLAGDALQGLGLLLLLLGLTLHLSLLVVVAQIAGLAHTHGVVEPVSVLAVPGKLVATKLTVTGGAHVLGVVLAVGMGALRNLHGACFTLLGSLLGFLIGLGGNTLIFSFKVGALAEGSVFLVLVEKLLLHEIMQQL